MHAFAWRERSILQGPRVHSLWTDRQFAPSCGRRAWSGHRSQPAYGRTASSLRTQVGNSEVRQIPLFAVE